MKCALAIVGFALLVVAVQVGADMAAWYTPTGAKGYTDFPVHVPG